MKRAWAARPREGYDTVEYEDALQAVVDLFTHVWRSGGVGTFMGARVRAPEMLADGLPGEAFTTIFVCEYKDRTDARAAPEETRPRPVAAPAPEEESEEADTVEFDVIEAEPAPAA